MYHHQKHQKYQSWSQAAGLFVSYVETGEAIQLTHSPFP